MKSGLLIFLVLLSLTGCGDNADERQAYRLLGQTLERSQREMERENKRELNILHRIVHLNGRRGADVFLADSLATEVLSLTDSVVTLLRSMEKYLRRVAAARPGNAGATQQYLSGHSPQGAEKLQLLYHAIRRQESRLTVLREAALPMPILPAPASRDTSEAGSPQALGDQFSNSTPEEALLVVAHLKARALGNAGSVLAFFLSRLGLPDQYRKVAAVAIPKVSTVRVGAPYEADLILAGRLSRDWLLIKAYLNGKPVSPYGKYSFVATNGSRAGSVQYWEGRFTFVDAHGEDTALTVRRPYRVYDRATPRPPQTPVP
ncbi:MAG: hypothetical protein AVDCRST_MAG56-2608 [uncultured Cytophagales bacterium]|uniref:Gliding motility-associated protein GldM first immunoglobulin-like domain-containing protein n=1 Tax=uncultured Cytophagales bacterium TaxID=158755 RepID=A0A6J4IUL6_9SPHI|nr:MAG: hypothetical protein AVDCRST_MAG56-2608 [uncultured Cytophagales bacterium]